MTSRRTTLRALIRPTTHVEAVSYLGYLIALLAYVVATFMAPIDTATSQYHLSTVSIRLLQLTILIPIAAVWAMALWGSLKFKVYAQKIYASSDGKALDLVSSGLLILVASLILPSVLQAFNSSIRAHADWISTWTIIVNYLSIGLALASFSLIFLGAHRLTKLVSQKGIHNAQLWSFPILALMGIIFALALTHSGKSLSASEAPYYLSSGMVLSTIVVPYLVIWFLGITAVLFLRNYQVNSTGIIYRRSLSNLSWGLSAIIGSSLLLQLIGAISTSLNHLELRSLLLLLYLLIVIYGLGHILVVIGARKLSRIEEVQ